MTDEPPTRPTRQGIVTEGDLMRHRLTATTVIAVIALAVLPTATGCGAVDKALGCATVAARIADDIQDLQNAVSGADSPQDVANALDRIAADLKDVGDATGNADVGKAVASLTHAVQNAQQTADQGKIPDIQPVVDAAAELGTVCTTG